MSSSLLPPRPPSIPAFLGFPWCLGVLVVKIPFLGPRLGATAPPRRTRSLAKFRRACCACRFSIARLSAKKDRHAQHALQDFATTGDTESLVLNEGLPLDAAR
jgi:hypothetical protein